MSVVGILKYFAPNYAMSPDIFKDPQRDIIVVACVTREVHNTANEKLMLHLDQRATLAYN